MLEALREYSPTELARIERYSRKVNRIISDGLKLQRKDLLQIRARFRSFRANVIREIPERYAMNRAAMARVLGRTAEHIDELTRDVFGTIRAGCEASAETVQAIVDAYGQEFVADAWRLPDIMGLAPEAINAAAAYSADLISLRQGGLGAKMLARVNRAIHLSALGAGPGAFNAAKDIWSALGHGKTWAWQAERIYRTEVLRVQSILTEQGIRQLNKVTPTRKQWRSSYIQRREHIQINGQTVAATRSFTVPLRDGGSAKMRFPRDPSAPPSATINCGCYEIPVPAPAKRSSTRRRPPAAKKKAPAKRALAPRGRVNAAKKRLATDYGIGPIRRKKRNRWDRAITDEQLASNLEAYLVELDRIHARFPAFRKMNIKNGIEFNLGGAGWMRGHEKMMLGLDAGFAEGSNIRFYQTPFGEKRIPFSTRRWNHGNVDLFRHEYGHAIDDFLGIHNDPEWRALLQKYPVRGKVKTAGENYPGSATSWWADPKNGVGSEYASRAYRWEHPDGLGGMEAWADLFRLVTRENYVKGTIPADLEAYVEKKLGGKIRAASSSEQAAFDTAKVQEGVK